jgi:hypothetical protein
MEFIDSLPMLDRKMSSSEVFAPTEYSRTEGHTVSKSLKVWKFPLAGGKRQLLPSGPVTGYFVHLHESLPTESVIVVYSGSEVARDVNPYHQKLKQFAKLPSNWNGYGSEAPNPFALFWAQVILDLADERAMTPFRVAASAEGGIGITFKKGDRIGALEALNSDSIVAVLSDRKSEPQVWGVVGREQLREALTTIATYLA